MRLVVLGGGAFVGWALAEAALARGWPVTCVTRGNRPVPAGAVHIGLNRTTADARVLAALAHSGDVVVDTWSGAAGAVESAAAALAGSVRGYCYISTRSVYRDWRPGADETAPVVDLADLGDDNYPVRKRRSELAVLAHFPRGGVVLRPGIVLGPRENLGRVAWWRSAVHDPGTRVLPGPADLPVQVLDVRDLAAFALDRLAAGATGVFDIAAPPVTIGELELAFVTEAGAPAGAVWADADQLYALGYRPWTSFPLWVPRSHRTYGYFDAACARARQHGLTTRPLRATVAASLVVPARMEDVPALAPGRSEREHLAAVITSA